MSQSSYRKSAELDSLNTICLPSGDQDSQKANLSGPRLVSCLTSLPSGFIVKISGNCTNAMRPFFPGKVALAWPTPRIRNAIMVKAGSVILEFIFSSFAADDWAGGENLGCQVADYVACQQAGHFWLILRRMMVRDGDVRQANLGWPLREPGSGIDRSRESRG